jgi:hypothetical protein
MNELESIFSPAQQKNIEAGHFTSRPAVWVPEDRKKTGFDAIAVDISQAKSAEEVLRLAGADFRVGHTSLFSFTGNLGESLSKQIPGTEAFVTKCDSHKMMWRLNAQGKPHIPLGVVGINWTPRQPADSLGDLLEWVGVGTPDKAYLYTDSTRLHIRYKMAETKILGDDVIAYSNVTDAYDGTMAYCLTDEIVRGVCRNGLVKLVEGSRNFRRKHTKSINASRQMIQAIMGSLRAKLQDLNNLAEETVRITVSEPRWAGIVEQLIPIPEEVKEEQLRVIEEKRSLLYTAIDMPDLANFKNSGWGVLNACADFSTHLGHCQRLGTLDTQVRKNRELNESNPLLEQALQLVRALA